MKYLESYKFSQIRPILEQSNRYHERFINSYGLLDGSVKYFKLQEKVLDFFNSLPDDETIEEWFTYLSDEFKISSIDTGFIDWESEYSFYNVIDTNSSNPVICVSFEGKDINQEGVNISDYKSKKDYKKDKKFVSNNPKFMLELASVINRASYYLGDNYKNYEDYKIYILSWGVVQVIIEFKKF